MASDLQWDHHFCLTCDKQTDGAAYCSAACQLADYAGAASIPSPPYGPSSPSWTPTGAATYPWATGTPSARCRQLFALTPTYDFSHAQTYGATPRGRRATAAAAAAAAGGSNSSSSASSALHNSASTSLLLTTPPAPTAATYAATAPTATTSVTYHHVLSPSSSHSSLSSVRSGDSSSGGALRALSTFANGGGSQTTSCSTSSATSSSDLSERVRNELRKYASSLEQGRLQRQPDRRRSC